MLNINNLSITRGVGEQSFSVALPKFHMKSGEVVVIQGASGCGKSTLLEMIGLVLTPNEVDTYQFGSGDNTVAVNQLIKANDQQRLAKIRAEKIGFMMQSGGLLSYLSIEDNLLLPSRILKIDIDKPWLSHLCNTLRIGHLLKKYPKQLSIGERQRVAFIRSVLHHPVLLLADEPTSALDPENSEILFNLIIQLARENNISVLMVSHDWELIKSTGLRNLSPYFNEKQRVSIFSENGL